MRRFYEANARSRETGRKVFWGSLRACTLAGLGPQFAALKPQRQWGAAPQRSLSPDLVRRTRRARESLSLGARGSGGRHPSLLRQLLLLPLASTPRHWLPSQRIRRFRAVPTRAIVAAVTLLSALAGVGALEGRTPWPLPPGCEPG